MKIWQLMTYLYKASQKPMFLSTGKPGSLGLSCGAGFSAQNRKCWCSVQQVLTLSLTGRIGVHPGLELRRLGPRRHQWHDLWSHFFRSHVPTHPSPRQLKPDVERVFNSHVRLSCYEVSTDDMGFFFDLQFRIPPLNNKQKYLKSVIHARL